MIQFEVVEPYRPVYRLNILIVYVSTVDKAGNVNVVCCILLRRSVGGQSCRAVLRLHDVMMS